MSLADDQALLDAVNAAILSLLQTNVSSYTLPNGAVYTRNDVQKLFSIRQMLERQIAAKTRSPIRVGKLGRPRPSDRL